MGETVFLGMDAGSTTVKLVLASADGSILASQYSRHGAAVRQTLSAMLDALAERSPCLSVSATLTGSAALSLAEALGLPFVQEVVAAARAITTGYDPRYVLPYVQMHEFEGLLFTNPADFEWAEDGWSEEVKAALMAVAQAFPNPEDINDSPETAPSKRILGIFPEGTYSKPEHGPLIAEATGITAIRAKCPAFNAWVAQLQAWGGSQTWR